MFRFMVPPPSSHRHLSCAGGAEACLYGGGEAFDVAVSRASEATAASYVGGAIALGGVATLPARSNRLLWCCQKNWRNSRASGFRCGLVLSDWFRRFWSREQDGCEEEEEQQQQEEEENEEEAMKVKG